MKNKSSYDGCSCHINPPCSHCENTSECEVCGDRFDNADLNEYSRCEVCSVNHPVDIEPEPKPYVYVKPEWEIDIPVHHGQISKRDYLKVNGRGYRNKMQNPEQNGYTQYPADFVIQLMDARFLIESLLKDEEGFAGIDFSDVGANGIQIRVSHTVSQKYGYVFEIPQPTINYDFSNIAEACEQLIDAFLKKNTPEGIRRMVHMYEDFKKYGTD